MIHLSISYQLLRIAINSYLNEHAKTRFISIIEAKLPLAGASGRAILRVGLRPLVCRDCGFESHRRHGCIFVVSVVYCQAEVSATS